MRKKEAAWIRTLKSLVVFARFFECIYLTNFFFADCVERSKFDKKQHKVTKKGEN